MFTVRITSITVKMVMQKHPLAPAMGYSLVPLYVFSLVSYFFEQSMLILPLSVFWGICLGKYFAKKNDKLSTFHGVWIPTCLVNIFYFWKKNKKGE